MDTYDEAPVNHGEKLSFEEVQLGHGDAADLRVMRVCAEGVAKSLAGDRDRGNHEAVAGERRQRELWPLGADLVHVVQREEQARFLGSPKSVKRNSEE